MATEVVEFLVANEWWQLLREKFTQNRYEVKRYTEQGRLNQVPSVFIGDLEESHLVLPSNIFCPLAAAFGVESACRRRRPENDRPGTSEGVSLVACADR